MVGARGGPFLTLEPDLFLVGQCHSDHRFLAPTWQTSRLRYCISGRLPGGGGVPGAAVFSLLGDPDPSFPTSDWGWGQGMSCTRG